MAARLGVLGRRARSLSSPVGERQQGSWARRAGSLGGSMTKEVAMLFDQVDSVLAFAIIMLQLSLLITAAVQVVVSMTGLRGRSSSRR